MARGVAGPMGDLLSTSVEQGERVASTCARPPAALRQGLHHANCQWECRKPYEHYGSNFNGCSGVRGAFDYDGSSVNGCRGVRCALRVVDGRERVGGC